jgi:hypothetical protein
MSALTQILRTLPMQETTRPGERVLRWGDELAVVVLDSGEIGQFATGGRWVRREVVDAVRSLK